MKPLVLTAAITAAIAGWLILGFFAPLLLLGLLFGWFAHEELSRRSVPAAPKPPAATPVGWEEWWNEG